jgi:hypothetical protein
VSANGRGDHHCEVFRESRDPFTVDAEEQLVVLSERPRSRLAAELAEPETSVLLPLPLGPMSSTRGGGALS